MNGLMIRIYIFFILLLVNFQSIFSSPSYLIRVANINVLSDSTISFEVYIKSLDSSFELTSYQCALCVENEFPVYGFEYNQGTSEMNNIIPSVGLGFNKTDGETKLTFASMPGSETISTKEIRIGRFQIKTDIDVDRFIPIIEWRFDGKINSILTGSNFIDITDSSGFVIENPGQIRIVGVSATMTSDTTTSPEKTIDGKCSIDGDENSRWAAEPMPASLIYDLGSNKKIRETKFSFYDWDNGRIYHYSISTSADSILWDEIVSDDSSSSKEWTVNAINKNARFVKLTFLSNNSWAGLWEAQIYGQDASTDTNNISTNIEDTKTAPKKYTLSQNYPNPFNPSTKINFTLANPGKVILEVYNILGEKVTTLIDREMSEGSHEINFNAANLASGIYVYRLNVDNKFSGTKKMMLLR